MASTPLTAGLAAAGLALALTGGAWAAGPALAAGPAPATGTGTVTDTSTSTATDTSTGSLQEAATTARLQRRLTVACARIPNALKRTTNLTTRLQAGATTRGSLAWLQAKIDKAEAAGQDELAATLRNRLAVRKSLLSVLPERTTWLTDLQGKVCSLLPAHQAGGGTTS